jgi:hypothetical protein
MSAARVHLLVLLVVSFFDLVPLRAVTIVKDGASAAALVVPDDAAPKVKAAAELMRETIRKISGADLAVVPESQAVASLLPIYVGPTKFAREKGIEMPNCFGHWGTQGLNYYVLAQMMWDPSRDPGAIVDDYCQRGFGAASPKVRQYIARLEELTHLFAVHEADRIGDPEAILAADEEPDTTVSTEAGKGPSGWEIVWTDKAMQQLQSILTDAASVVERSTPEAWRIAVLQEGLEFAKLELPTRRYFVKYEQDPSDENAFGLALECARVEQWMLARPQSRGVAVTEGYGWWWRKMRVPPIVRGTLRGKAVSLGNGSYKLSIAAYSSDGRYTTVQFSEDGGSTWSAEEPFKVDREYRPARRTDKIIARLRLKSASTQKQVETTINLK